MKKRLLLFAVAISATSSLFAQEAKYEIKSAIVTQKMEAMGQTMEMTQYFDDYGKKECVDTKIPTGVAGASMTVRSIQKGDTVYAINMEYKTGQKTVLPEKPVNYLNLTPEVVKNYKIEELGTEEFLGKECKKYRSETNQNGVNATATTWIWKGLPLKSVVSAGGMNMTMTVTEIKENATISPDVFEIPAGVAMQ